MEIKTPLKGFVNDDGDTVLLIEPETTFNDVLRYVLEGVGDKDEFLFMAEQIYHDAE